MRTMTIAVVATILAVPAAADDLTKTGNGR